MTPRLPSLSHLKCFESAARHQSFTASAQELGMTQSAISKKIKELEAELSVELFKRVGRGVVLTAAGQNLAENLEVDLARLQQTMRQTIAAGSGKHSLAVAVLPTFANSWLIPRLPDFYAKHPEIELSFATRLEPFDFERSVFDLAVHFGMDNWPGVKLTRLFGETMVPVCAPSFLTAHNLDNLENLAQVNLLHLSSRRDTWPNWFEKSGLSIAPRHDGSVFDQHSMVISGAVAALGVAIVPLDMVATELAEGRLVRLKGPTLKTHQSYFLVRPFGKASDPALAFETWAKEQSR